MTRYLRCEVKGRSRGARIAHCRSLFLDRALLQHFPFVLRLKSICCRASAIRSLPRFSSSLFILTARSNPNMIRPSFVPETIHIKDDVQLQSPCCNGGQERVFHNQCVYCYPCVAIGWVTLAQHSNSSYSSYNPATLLYLRRRSPILLIEGHDLLILCMPHSIILPPMKSGGWMWNVLLCLALIRETVMSIRVFMRVRGYTG